MKLPSSSIPHLRILCSVVYNAVTNEQQTTLALQSAASKSFHLPPPVVLSLGAGAEVCERLVTRDQFYVWSLTDDYDSRTEIAPIGRIDSSSAL